MALTAEKVSVITVYLPTNLRERARSVAKRLRKSSSDLVRDSLAEKVESFEEKFRREEAQREAEKAARRRPSASASAVGIAPAPAPPTIGSFEMPKNAPRVDKLTLAYEKLAKEILAVEDNGDEVKRRAKAAVIAIKREFPLTHPADAEILATLENVVVRLRDALPATPPSSIVAAPHPAVGTGVPTQETEQWKIIDTKQVKSFGDI